MITKALSTVPAMSHFNSVHLFKPHFCKINFIIISQYKFMFPSGLVPSGSVLKFYVHFSLSPVHLIPDLITLKHYMRNINYDTPYLVIFFNHLLPISFKQIFSFALCSQIFSYCFPSEWVTKYNIPLILRCTSFHILHF